VRRYFDEPEEPSFRRKPESRNKYQRAAAMNPERLLQHFETISEVDDAVPWLRQFILDLAIRGKVVEQNSEDETAEKLLRRIDAEKKRLVESGDIPKQKLLPPLDVDVMAFAIPATWKWVPIRSVTTDRGQKVPDKRFSYIDVSAIDKERGVITGPQVLAPNAAPSRARKIVLKGDVIYSCVRPYLLNIAIVDKEFSPEPIVSTAFAVLNGLGFVLPRYLWIVLRSPYFVGKVEKKMRGQAYPAINDGDFAPLPIPLPPLAEQHRIVAKVDELMTLCDELEAARTKRETRRDHLVAATLHLLNNGNASPEDGNDTDFKQTARFYFNHLQDLTIRPEHIKQLLHTIFHYAFSGKLVEQAAGDEPASKLLERISRKKQALIASKKIRQGKVSRPLTTIDAPSHLPSGWEWANVDSLCFKVTDGTHFTPRYVGSGVRFVSAKDIVGGKLVFDRCKYITQEEHEQLYRRCNPQYHDIVITKSGSIGTAALVEDHGEFSLFESLALLKFDQLSLYPRYFVYALNHACRSLTAGHIRGVGVKHLHLDILRGLELPLPPLAEQRRIVAKVDEHIALCDELQAQLTTTATTRRQLLEATLHEALSGQIGQKALAIL
jgi:type I restriction enzyme S subunit